MFWKKKRPEITEEQRLEAACYPVIVTDFHGVPLPVKIRELTATQLWGIGNMSLIETFEDKLSRDRDPTVEEMNAYAERHHKILQLALVNPTYEHLMSIAGAHLDSEEVENRLKSIKAMFLELPEGKEKRALKKEYEALELSSKFILPGEFTGPIVEYLTGAKRTDVKKITDDMLFQWAVLASRGGDNPADHAVGNYKRWPDDSPQARLYGTDSMIAEDINNRAWIIYDERTRKKA